MKKNINSQVVMAKVLADGNILETVFDESGDTQFVVSGNSGVDIVDKYKHGKTTYLPYSSSNKLLKNGVVHLSGRPVEYESLSSLLQDIQKFIHKYVDVDEEFEKVVSYYVLLSWVFDAFGEIPYLKIRGDYGTGKTRFLKVVGSLCYRPIFASGASSVAPIYHILDSIGGTLILDEADFRYSDEKSDLTKILNNGNTKGLQVLRCRVSKEGNFTPTSFNVFSPKIVSSRGVFTDQALESRFISYDSMGREVRSDIPESLPSSFSDEALHLRNMLLMFRMKNLASVENLPQVKEEKLDPRVKQIFSPLFQLAQNNEDREVILREAQIINEEMRIDRGLDVEAHTLISIRSIWNIYSGRVTIKSIRKEFEKMFGKEYDRRITSKWIGYQVRKRLNLRTVKSNGNYIISQNQTEKLKKLYRVYGLDE